MKTGIAVLVVLALTAFAAIIVNMPFAGAQESTPEVQALSDRVLQELNIGLQCAAQVIMLKKENAKLKAEIEESKKPKKD